MRERLLPKRVEFTRIQKGYLSKTRLEGQCGSVPVGRLMRGTGFNLRLSKKSPGTAGLLDSPEHCFATQTPSAHIQPIGPQNSDTLSQRLPPPPPLPPPTHTETPPFNPCTLTLTPRKSPTTVQTHKVCTCTCSSSAKHAQKTTHASSQGLAFWGFKTVHNCAHMVG